MSRPAILVVGNCYPDNFTFDNWFNQHFDVEFLKAANRHQALEVLAESAPELVLINRVFDADGGCGISLVREIKESTPDCRVMLISNFADAQEKAVANGALDGFGKAELNSVTTISKVRAALG